jgi:hypothetical protein
VLCEHGHELGPEVAFPVMLHLIADVLDGRAGLVYPDGKGAKAFLLGKVACGTLVQKAR